jgi:hypothetical protein
MCIIILYLMYHVPRRHMIYSQNLAAAELEDLGTTPPTHTPDDPTD